MASAPKTASTTTATTPATPRAARLDAGQIATFEREGFVVVPEPVFAPERFAALAAHFDELLAAKPEHVHPESMDVPHFTDLALFDWLFDPAVLDLVEPLLGPDLALFSSHFICKPGADGKRVPWHEDAFYWRDLIEPMRVVTVWLAIDPSDRDNGCMRVIPRALHGASEYEPCEGGVFGQEIKRGAYDASRAVDIVLAPNHASLHESKLMHGSNANTSGRRRCGYTMRYISTATRFDQDRHPFHQIYLARGRDRAGNRYGDPTVARPELYERRAPAVKKGH